MNDRDIHAQLGPYVLDALPDDERREFESHLRDCDACRQEIAGLTETATLLGAAAAQSPPEGFRDRVLDQVSRTRQLPPLVTPAMSRRRRWLHRATAIAAAACLVVAVATGAVAIRAQQRAEQLEAQQQRITSVLSAPDVRVTAGVQTSHGDATVAASQDRDRVLFLLHQPRRLPADKTYQLWLLTADGTARSAGLVPHVGAGDRDTRTVVAGPLGDARQVGVTIEPEGGSSQPTTDPVMLVRLP